MTYSVNLKQQLPQKSKQFQEFVFVNDSAMKLVPKSFRQLQVNPNSDFLNEAEIGDFIKIKQICTSHDIIRQLQNLKFKPGKIVQLVSKTDNGSVIVNLNNTLLGIGAEIAQRIVVTSVETA